VCEDTHTATCTTNMELHSNIFELSWTLGSLKQHQTRTCGTAPLNTQIVTSKTFSPYKMHKM
jgi:hypothetical protein